ncbi:MAG: hypothetical protein V7L02_19845 [Nostoc sp.]|uniref:hypothetical protein n=1 Tax=Nostoc sp. TaxID=1180 RepID=UPI002FF6506E
MRPMHWHCQPTHQQCGQCIRIVSRRINNAADALALQGIAKFNSLQINKMLYLVW